MTDQTTRRGYNGSDLRVGDYVAIVNNDGTQQPVLGRITSFGDLEAKIDDRVFIRNHRLVRTSQRQHAYVGPLSSIFCVECGNHRLAH